MQDEFSMTEQLQRYYTLWRESNTIYEEWAKSQVLSLNTLLILYSFYEDSELCTQKRISQKWLIPKQTVNAALKDFEGKGYIKLVPIPSDKRNKQILMTPCGEEFADSIISRLRKRELYVMEQMGFENIKTMNDQLALFIELFSKGEEAGEETDKQTGEKTDKETGEEKENEQK